jgi:hypothetical protein
MPGCPALRRAIRIGVIALVAVVPATSADDSAPTATPRPPEQIVYDATAAFEYFKSLDGDWTRAGGSGGHEAGARSTTFRVSAAGSTVIGTIYPGDQNEMINVFHMDGDDLLLTHYCALQNAPIMKFVPSEQPGEIRFEFHGGTNFDPSVDAHVHEGVFRIKDSDNVESAFVSHAGGKPGPGTSSKLRRKAPR